MNKEERLEALEGWMERVQGWREVDGVHVERLERWVVQMKEEILGLKKEMSKDDLFRERMIKFERNYCPNCKRETLFIKEGGVCTPIMYECVVCGKRYVDGGMRLVDG